MAQVWSIDDGKELEFTSVPVEHGYQVIAENDEGSHWDYLDTFGTQDDADRWVAICQQRQEQGKPFGEAWAVGW